MADPGPLSLRSGFNLVTWAGPSGLEPASAFAGLGDHLSPAFAFEPETEIFSSYGPSRPPFVNDLEALTYGDGFWALRGTATAWDQPPAPAPVEVALDDGSAVLRIPRGALLAGTDAAAIQIRDASAPEGDPGLTFALLPEGTVFATPATVTFSTSTDTPSFIGVLVGADTVELVDVTSVRDAGSRSIVHSASKSSRVNVHVG